MTIRNLNKWLDKREWEIKQKSNNEDFEYPEEEEDGFCGSLDRDKVNESCDEATFDLHREEYLNENKEELINDFKQKNKEYKKTEDIKENEEFKDFVENRFYDDRCGDDYAPIWLRAWEFPSRYTAEKLNSFDIKGLVFFDMKYKTFVSLTTCGMDMSPSLEFAYFMYSNLKLSKKYIQERIFKQPSYFTYVIGNKDFIALCEKIGITKRKIKMAEKRVNKRMKEFQEGLNSLSKLRDDGKMTQTEAGLLGLIKYFNHEKEEEKEIKKLTN
jgi:hypothetical protein